MEISADVVARFFALEPLSPLLAATIDPDADLEALAEDVDEIDHPVAKERYSPSSTSPGPSSFRLPPWASLTSPWTAALTMRFVTSARCRRSSRESS